MTPLELGTIFGTAMLGAVLTASMLVRFWVFAKAIIR